MNHETSASPNPEYLGAAAFSEKVSHPSSFDWRASFAGALVALLAYTILMSLGLAIATANFGDTSEIPGIVHEFGIGSALWTIFATSASLFVGAYVAGRVGTRRIVEAHLGWAVGLVVASLFFFVLFLQVGAALGAASRGLEIIMNSVVTNSGDLTSIRIAAWTFFGSTLIGTLVSTFGGVIGARAQTHEPRRPAKVRVEAMPVHA